MSTFFILCLTFVRIIDERLKFSTKYIKKFAGLKIINIFGTSQQ